MAISIDLGGKVAIVTGAGRGIGRAIAVSLAQAGADVCVAARTASQIEETAELVRGLGRRAVAVRADVSNSGEVRKVVETAVGELGGLHILVNNAGIELPKPILETSEEEYENVMNVNVKSAFLFTREAGPHMIAQKFGRIVNMSSVGGIAAGPNQAIYQVSKAAIAHLTKSTAIEWARHNITVNAVAPGWVNTEIISHFANDPEKLRKFLAPIPLKRLGEPEEIGPLVAYLCSDLASFMTGSVVVADGGLTIP